MESCHEVDLKTAGSAAALAAQQRLRRLWKRLHQQCVFSQPYTERKHSLVSRMLEYWRQEFHGFDLGKGLRFYLLAESLDFSSLCVRSASQLEWAN